MVNQPGQRHDIGGQSTYPGGPSNPGSPDTSHQGSRETMSETAMAAAEHAKSAAAEKIEEQKRAASQSIDAFAQAVRRASDELKNQDQTAAAQLIAQAAGGLESLSRSLSNQSIGDMVNTMRDFGRRNPWALAGGAVLLGLALGRVARTAAGGPEQEGYGEPMSSTQYPRSGAYGSGTGPSSRIGSGAGTAAGVGSGAGYVSDTSPGQGGPSAGNAGLSSTSGRAGSGEGREMPASRASSATGMSSPTSGGTSSSASGGTSSSASGGTSSSASQTGSSLGQGSQSKDASKRSGGSS